MPAELSPLDQSTLIHWHVPSEHTVGGRRFPIEMHIVHNVTESQTAVLGILFEHVDIHNPYVDQLLRQRGLKEFLAQIDFTYYYSYSGSLTTEPYAEGILWTVPTQT